ncbi:DNA cytosine methyltransferase [Pigmentiphaga aceris]|uniref:Cytosine-specific methyltransferase n=1 Tax=Pigmentiphaga aceris TaxID=1940612 RepID=A0A5C0AU95_9BURK|nr:DNA cytosine methyltransferase [Pigmentiphaga aceris]QEI04480.1 DNA cytosine methyltransferase [Pigmentiphaga aceris]
MSAWIAQAINERIQRDTQPAQPQSARNVRQGRRFYEFFAGGGMARAGLGPGWDCLFANDFNPMKGRVYRDNWEGGLDLLVEDINKVTTEQLPDQADLVWASFPCQDLSLAGFYKGIGCEQDQQQTRSGTFWPFWQLMRNLMAEGRPPRVIVLENVYGVLTSNKGNDFAAIGAVFAEAGYRFGAMVIDARHFLPQSRPRVFVVGVHESVPIPPALISQFPVDPWHPKRMVTAYAGLSQDARKCWVWWNVPVPQERTTTFTDLIEEHPEHVRWDSAEKTNQLLNMMSPTNLAKVHAVQKSGERKVGGLYKRTRLDEHGVKVQRAEVRFDDIAGCLRTPAGGSSRQVILVVEGQNIRSRLLSPREAARLMGIGDAYRLPVNYNDAYHVAGDGVAVPVVRHLAAHIFEPLLS